MAREAALADAAGHAMHDRDARPVLELACDLVPEHRSGRRAAELLHVGATEPTGTHTHEQTGARGLRQIGELREPVRVENYRAHRPIVGRRARFSVETLPASRAG